MTKSTSICVEFRIMGEHFNIEDVTQTLSISPTESWEKGSPIYNTQGKIRAMRKYTNWCYSTGVVETLDVNTQMAKIEDIFKSKINMLKQLKETYNLSFSVDIIIIIINEQSPALCLNGFILKLVAALNARIDIDISTG